MSKSTSVDFVDVIANKFARIHALVMRVWLIRSTTQGCYDFAVITRSRPVALARYKAESAA